MANVDELLGLLGPSPDDQQAARQAAILQFGLGLLGTPKGGEWGAVRNAAQAAAQGRQQYLDNGQLQRMRTLQMRGSALDYLSHQQQYDDAELLRQQQMEAARRFAPGSLQPTTNGGASLSASDPVTGMPTGIQNPPSVPSMPNRNGSLAPKSPIAGDPMNQPPAFGMNDRSSGVALPPPPNIPMLPSNGQPSVPGTPDRRAMAIRLNQIGDYWSSVGRMQQADTYYKAAQAAMPQLKEQKTVTQSGQRVLLNVYNDGSQEMVPNVGPDKEKLHFADTGNTAGVGMDPYSGAQVTPGLPKTMTPGEQANTDLRRLEVDPFGMLANAAKNGGPGAGTPGVSGDDFLQGIPKPMADQVRALAEGRMPFPSGFALKSPYWQNMISMVSQYDPSFDAINFNARAKTRNDFTSGQSARQVNAMNTVIGHLDTLSHAADALNNTSYPAYNTAANFVASNIGDPRMKQFDATKKAVVDELTRVWRGNGGSEGDIKTWASTLDAANSPEQLHGVINEMGHLLESKVSAMNEQYTKGMGTAGGGLNLLSPQSRSVLNRLEQKVGGTPDRTADAANAPPQISPSAKGNATATALISRILKSGDQSKINELRQLGWLQ
jgi:hypothetical protein